MNELSQRLKQATDFLEKSGYAKSDMDIIRNIGASTSFFNMAKNGEKNPSWDLLLKLCDHYPISFDWLRTGKGRMIKGERELMLLKRIEELEREIAELKK